MYLGNTGLSFPTSSDTSLGIFFATTDRRKILNSGLKNHSAKRLRSLPYSKCPSRGESDLLIPTGKTMRRRWPSMRRIIVEILNAWETSRSQNGTPRINSGSLNLIVRHSKWSPSTHCFRCCLGACRRQQRVSGDIGAALVVVCWWIMMNRLL